MLPIHLAVHAGNLRGGKSQKTSGFSVGKVGWGGGWRIVGVEQNLTFFVLKVECLEEVNNLQKIEVEAAVVVYGSMVSNGFDECGNDDDSEVICNDHGHGQA